MPRPRKEAQAKVPPKVPRKEAQAKVPPKVPRKVYVVSSAVEMLVDETTEDALMKVLKERAKQLGVPLGDLKESGLIRVFAGDEIVLEVEEPRVRFGNEPV